MIPLDTTPFASLAAHLLDLIRATEGKKIPLILVGGFGMTLRRERVVATKERTLYDSLPSLRTTEDFDLLLQLEALADMNRMSVLRATLDALGYIVVPSAQNFQFFLQNSNNENRSNVKIDLLARQPEAEDPPLIIKGHRIMPRKNNNPLHAYMTPEAIAAEYMLQKITVSGALTTGEAYQGSIFLPHPYAIYLMKLFAFRDEENAEKGKGREPYARKHARDLYTLTELLTQTEYDELSIFRARYQKHPIAIEAGQIVQDFLEIR